MLNDTDKWPVVCAECRKADFQEIARLKNTLSFRCPSCRSELPFDNEKFVNVLENLRRTVDGFARTAVLTKRRAE